jgi:digeranylgeranylglycerophospholipid reductase
MKIDRELCDVCGTCAAVCPKAAITIREFDVHIDKNCNNCKKCSAVCPPQAISTGQMDFFSSTAVSVETSELPYYDVIVIGAGPSGSTAARYAAEGGLSVLLLERDREPGVPVRCAEGVSHNGLLHFIEIDPKWVSTTIEGARLHSPDGGSVEMYNNGLGYVLDRRVFDKALADLAVLKGAKLLTKADAIDLLRDEKKKVCGVIYRHEKKLVTVRCRILIGADGIESQVGRWAGIKTTLALGDLDTCCQYTVNNINVEKHLCQFYFGKDIAPGGYLWIFPKSETQANIGIGIGGDDARPGKGPRYYLDRYIEQKFPNASINFMVYGGVPTRAGNDFIADNVMLVGDAAHQVNPITGGGIIQGMIAARYAGETAVKAINENNTSKKSLKPYADRWEAHMGKNQRFMYQLKTKFMGMNDRVFNTLVATCKRIPAEELNLYRLFQETLKEDPLMLASLATSFVVSKLK